MSQLRIIAMGLPDLIVIVALAMVLFGGKRLGDIGKGLGEGIRNFRVAVKDNKTDDDKKKTSP